MGENRVKSRQALGEIKSKADREGKEVIRLEGKKLELSELKQALEAESLFGDGKQVVVEELFSAPDSKRKQELINYLKKNETDLIIWEGKKIDRRKLKSFKAKIKEFEVSSLIFKLMDSLAPGNTEEMLEYLKECLEQESAEMVFYMLARQVRLMLQASQAAKEFQGPGWLKKKMGSQAESFGEEGLLALHQKLYEIDKGVKTGSNPLELDTQLEMLLLSL